MFFFKHIFIPIHTFDLGESLPQWEQSQGREFKHNQPNEGRVFAKSGVSIKKSDSLMNFLSMNISQETIDHQNWLLQFGCDSPDWKDC